MAFYRRRRQYGRRGRGRRRRGGFGGSAIARGAHLAWRAWRMAKYIKGLVNSELYKFDITSSGASVPDTGLVGNITAIAQGDGVSARTGNSIYARSVNVHGEVSFNISSTQVSQVIRVAVIMDTQQVGDTSPTTTDVYGAIGPFAHLNVNTVGRYKILWTRNYEVDINNPTARIMANIPMRHHVRYNGTASSDIQKGGLYLMLMSNQSTTYFPTYTGECRLSYHDN